MKQYHVDAFTDHIFAGNPATVCVLDEWLSDDLMLNIAKENNLSEAAFVIKEESGYHLRWFTPGGEIDFCGHATLASAYVILNYYEKSDEVTFYTLSGILTVKKKKELYEMNSPAYKLQQVEITQKMQEALGCPIKEAYLGRDLLCILENENDVYAYQPDFEKIMELDGLLLHISAKSTKYDCVSRSFAPKLEINEDPVCGSGHCHIIPYYTKKLKKDSIVAYQASSRGGILYCHQQDNRILISGNVCLFSVGEIYI